MTDNQLSIFAGELAAGSVMGEMFDLEVLEYACRQLGIVFPSSEEDIIRLRVAEQRYKQIVDAITSRWLRG
jgi:hypothetical protein